MMRAQMHMKHVKIANMEKPERFRCIVEREKVPIKKLRLRGLHLPYRIPETEQSEE